MPRPSPRTGSTGAGVQKFGTQQLKFVEPPKLGTPYQGVKQVDTGKNFKKFTTSGYTGTKTTVFSERFQSGITGATPTPLRETAIQRQAEKLAEMGIPKLPDLGELGFPDLFGIS